MALQSHHRTSSHKRRRAAHFALKKIKLSACKECGGAVQSHRLCPKCGHYQKGKKKE
ncbi:MAG: 50S ribosomal protein L32 [Candidatus Komeilibacteria bacterium RIFCSPLOWO2_02_FULL_48_11]|uniref:Large ribosomal subunit protein bL32 n=1 Tax=Candidatus Komeilibacteria bacterium RIFCSPLOWO2_02_FULL_48_11 TaxID=1798553 RepID=A0A1G2BS23_9BACT|nr:MAG: 50S ribosomal protein L32 [Candidatus Komeilibacteria bacterium RIFCSPLOWO2_02_FULL_48_11]